MKMLCPATSSQGNPWSYVSGLWPVSLPLLFFLITLLGATLGSGPVEKFQIVQDEIDRVTLKVVVDGSFPEERLEADLEQVRARLAEVMGPACQGCCESVPHIPTQPSGKYLFTVCNVDRSGAELSGLSQAARQAR